MAPDDMAAWFSVGSTSQLSARLVALRKVRKQMRTSPGKTVLIEQAKELRRQNAEGGAL